MKFLFLIGILSLCMFFVQCSNQPSTLEVSAIIDKMTIRGSDNLTFSNPNSSNTSTAALDAGTLTAGRWDDLENWEFWQMLMQESTYEFYQEYWKLYPKQRYDVQLLDEHEEPIHDLKVLLLNSKGKTLWETHTNHQGKAVLWEQPFAAHTHQEQNLNLALVTKNGRITNIGAAIPFEEGGVQRKYISEIETKEIDQLEVLFMVDATGSMQDEIDYLKKELQDVVEQYKVLQPKTKLKLGSIFYRDYPPNADYLMKTTSLSDNLDVTFQFINQQNANGGGDFEEALEAALTTAVEEQQWSEEQAVRIAFVLLDASAHHKPKSLQQVQKSLRLAASKGIRLIPITSSGIDKETEFLMRFFAILTGGTYVFITDHSGVGKGHIEPTVGTYDVQYLNDLLLNLLQEYTNSTIDVVQ